MATPWPVGDPHAAENIVKLGAKIIMNSIDEAIFFDACRETLKTSKDIPL